MNKLINKIKNKLLNKRAEGFVDSGIKILIAVVVGAVLLAGLIFIFQTNILPKVTNRVRNIAETNGLNTKPSEHNKFYGKIELVSLTTSNTRLVRGEKAKFFITIRNNSDYDIPYDMNSRVYLGAKDSGGIYFFHFVADAHSETTIEVELSFDENAIVGDKHYRVEWESPQGVYAVLTQNQLDEDFWSYWNFPHLPPIE